MLDLVSYHSANKQTMPAWELLGIKQKLSFVYIYILPDTRVLNSFEELCIMQAAAIYSFARVLNPHRGAYILSSTQRLFCCITTLLCGQTHKMLEAGIETCPTLRQTQSQPTSKPHQLGNNQALSSSFCLFTFIHYRIPE